MQMFTAQILDNGRPVLVGIVKLGFGNLLHDVAHPAFAYKAIAIVVLVEKYYVHL
jgi:hypothetical protein